MVLGEQKWCFGDHHRGLGDQQKMVAVSGASLQGFRTHSVVPSFSCFFTIFKGQDLPFFGAYLSVYIKWGWGFVEVDGSLPTSGERTWKEAREGESMLSTGFKAAVCMLKKRGRGRE